VKKGSGLITFRLTRYCEFTYREALYENKSGSILDIKQWICSLVTFIDTQEDCLCNPRRSECKVGTTGETWYFSQGNMSLSKMTPSQGICYVCSSATILRILGGIGFLFFSLFFSLSSGLRRFLGSMRFCALTMWWF
jgi:hypothetical protein